MCTKKSNKNQIFFILWYMLKHGAAHNPASHSSQPYRSYTFPLFHNWAYFASTMLHKLHGIMRCMIRSITEVGGQMEAGVTSVNASNCFTRFIRKVRNGWDPFWLIIATAFEQRVYISNILPKLFSHPHHMPVLHKLLLPVWGLKVRFFSQKNWL